MAAQPYRAPARPRTAPAPRARAQAPAAPPARAQAPRPAVARAQNGGPKAPPRPAAPPPPAMKIEMPAPEALGVRLTPAAKAPEGEDWLPLLRRLDEMGMSRFEFAPHPGGYRFACVLPGERRLEATGASKAEVLRQALAKAEAAR